jgi:catechol 2,3-dioxygenase-like lactoylglutathione lyase family enzyme
MIRGTQVRVARPTDKLDEVVHFYRDGLGLTELGSFTDHAGFDGVMLGNPGEQYHLEFTRQLGYRVGKAPTKDNLLVFYIPNREDWQQLIDRMAGLGYQSVPSYNPYWDEQGRTFEDPDGYRVVLQNSEWGQQ